MNIWNILTAARLRWRNVGSKKEKNSTVTQSKDKLDKLDFLNLVYSYMT